MLKSLKTKLGKDKDLSELIKGSSTSFIIRIIGIISGYIFTLIIARFYGAEALGIFVLSLTVLQIFSVFGKAGLDNTSLRFVAELSSQGKWSTLKEFYKKSLYIAVPISIFFNILFFISAPYIATYIFKKPYLTDYFKLISTVYIPFVLLFIHSEAIRGLKKIAQYMFIQRAGIFIVASILLLIVSFFLQKSAYIPIVVYIFSLCLISFIAVYQWNRYLKLCTNPADSRNISYRDILSVSIPLLFANTAGLIMSWTDIVMLGMFRTEEDVGIYNVAQKLAMLVSLPLMAINTIAAPKFAEFWGRRDLTSLTKVAKQSTKLIFWTSFPFVILFLLFPDLFLEMFGENFKVGTWALIFLTLGQFVNAVSGSVGYILQMTGNQVYYQNVIFVGSLINIILNLILIPKFGITGAAVSSMVSVIYWNFAFGYKVRKLLGKWIVYIPYLNR